MLATKVGPHGLAKDLYRLRNLIQKQFLGKCASTMLITGPLVCLTTQLAQAGIFAECDDVALISRVRQQCLAACERASLLHVSTSLPPPPPLKIVSISGSLSTAMSRSPSSACVSTSNGQTNAETESVYVYQYCGRCKQVTKQRRQRCGTKCPTRERGDGPTWPKPKKSRRMKRKKPKHYYIFTCTHGQCAAQYSFCPSAKNHPMLINSLLETHPGRADYVLKNHTSPANPLLPWTSRTITSKILGTRTIMEMCCMWCKQTWTQCAEVTCKALYISGKGSKGNRSVQRHWETVRAHISCQFIFLANCIHSSTPNPCASVLRSLGDTQEGPQAFTDE